MQERERKAVQLNAVQIMAAALASVSAAVIGSTFGLTGTLIGAAVTSVVSTVGGALYTHSLEQARTRVRRRRNPSTGMTGRDVLPAPSAPAAPRTLSWGLVMGAAVLVFALALGLITTVEVAAHQPMARLVGSAAPGELGQAETTVGTVLQEVAEVAEVAEPMSSPDSPAQPTPSTTPERASTSVVPGVAPARTATPVPTAPTVATAGPRQSQRQSQPAPAKETPAQETPTRTATTGAPLRPTMSAAATSAAPAASTPRASTAVPSTTP